MKIEKLRSKLKKVFNRVMGVLLPVATLFVSCGTNALMVHAAESSNVHVISGSFNYNSFIDSDKYQNIGTFTLSASGNVEFLGVYGDYGYPDVRYECISIYLFNKDTNKYATIQLTSSGISCVGNYKEYKNDKLINEYENYKNYFSYIPVKAIDTEKYHINSYSLEGDIKIFKGYDSMVSYVKSGDTSGMIEIKDPENEKDWYLKNVSYKVTADDSPSSEAGADATYIHFSWDTDNLQDGDLLEIKTYNYYKKILGEKLSGFYDFITYSDGVNASSGKYSFSQYTATKAWFNSLENKPLAFKEYDTTDYYLRPVRMGTLGVEKYGGWVHIKMGRSTPTSSPYIEDIEYGDFDDDNNWTVDEDLTDKNGGHHGVDQGGGYIPPDQSDNPFTGTNIAGIFSYFYDFMKQIPAMLGDLPALVGNIISFLPKPIIAFIGIGVLVAIILRIVGR